VTSVNLSSSTLRKAAEIQERIERFQEELNRLFQEGAEGISTPVAGSAVARTATSRRRNTRKTGRIMPSARVRRGRSTSSSGPLAPAVVAVLESRNAPMGVSEILDGLLANGYKFASPEPKKNLFARIYRLKGVKKVGPGKFIAG
jgi:hypothetical protein